MDTKTSRSSGDVAASPVADPSRGTGTAHPGRRRGLRTLALVLATTLLVMTVAAGAWTWARSTDSRRLTFAATVDRIVVENVNGQVTLEAGTSGDLTVQREWLLTGAPDVETVENEGILRITGHCGSLCRVHVSGTVPAGTGVVVTTEAGSIDVAGLTAGVDLTTSAGNVNVTDVRGPVTLRTDAGWIRGSISGGDVDARTSAGGIDLDIDGEFSLVSAVTEAGSVRVSVPDDVYRVEAETSVGSTSIDVPTDPDAARVIVARSDAGDVAVDRLSR